MRTTIVAASHTLTAKAAMPCHMPRFIERQRFGGSGIARIGMAGDIGEALTVPVHDLEAAV